MLMTTILFFYNKLYFIFWKNYSAHRVGKIHVPIFLTSNISSLNVLKT